VRSYNEILRCSGSRSAACSGSSHTVSSPPTIAAGIDATTVAKLFLESSRAAFEVCVGGRLVRGELNPKTLRRVVTVVAAGQCSTVILQGRLDGDKLTDAGISAVSVG